MKKAFTLVELLVVIAIIAILAAMLMPALTRARQEANKSNCRANLHNIGLAISMLRNDIGQLYPGHINSAAVDDALDGRYLEVDGAIRPESWVEDEGGPWYRVAKGYLNGAEALDDPGWDAGQSSTWRWGYPRLQDWTGASDAPFDWIDAAIETGAEERTGESSENSISLLNDVDASSWEFDITGCQIPYRGIVAGAEYGFDVGRIHKNSNAGRVVAGCIRRLWHAWGINASGGYDPAHKGGGNLLYIDGAVQFADEMHSEGMWALDDLSDGSWIDNDDGVMLMMGYLPNPRLDEDAYLARSDSPQMEVDLLADLDSAYVCDVMDDGTGNIVPYADDSDPDEWKSGVQWDRDYLAQIAVQDDWTLDVLAPTPGDMCETEEDDCWDNSESDPWRPYTMMGAWYSYDQRGIFATEPRWNKYDARLTTGTPWYLYGAWGWPYHERIW